MQFISANCEQGVQEQVATYLGIKLRLKSLNHIIVHGAAGPLKAQLEKCAVAACINAVPAQSAADVLDVARWVIRERNAELMASIMTKLTSLCASVENFSALFAFPAVVAELKTDSPISAALQSLVLARISVVTPKTIVPAFSWSIPGVRCASGNQQVTDFLAGPQQIMILRGFSGIGQARQCAYRISQGCLTAVPSGQGKTSAVTLTKNRAHYNVVLKKCADSQEELNKLFKMLRVRDSSGVTPVGVQQHHTGAEQPAEKRQRTTDEIVAVGGTANSRSSSSSNNSSSSSKDVEVIDLT